MRPTVAEYPPFAAGYVSFVPESDVLPILERQPDELRALLRPLVPDCETLRYAPEKWSVREVVGHLTDFERVFGYRAFCISRREAASLPGFDQDPYVEASTYDLESLETLLAAFQAVRLANLFVLRTLTEEAWSRMGMAGGNALSVRGAAFILAGHVRHHQAELCEKYLPAAVQSMTDKRPSY